MEMRELIIRKREGMGKAYAKRLRRAGQVPAILYGGAQPVNVTVAPRDIYRLVHGHEGSTRSRGAVNIRPLCGWRGRRNWLLPLSGEGERVEERVKE